MYELREVWTRGRLNSRLTLECCEGCRSPHMLGLLLQSGQCAAEGRSGSVVLPWGFTVRGAFVSWGASLPMCTRTIHIYLD